MISLHFQEAVLRGVQGQPAVKEWGSSRVNQHGVSFFKPRTPRTPVVLKIGFVQAGEGASF